MTDSAITGVLRLISKGNTLEALSELFRLSDDKPLEALNRVLYSHTRESANPTVASEKERHQALLADSSGRDRAIVLYNLGCMALYQDDIVEAKLHFEQAFELYPQWLPICHNLAFTHELMAEWEDAERFYRKSGSGLILSRLNLALLKVQDERRDEGLDDLRGLLTESPDNPSIALYLARALLHRGSLDDAEEVMGMLEGLPGWRNYPDLRECHAYSCFLLARIDEAEVAFRGLINDDSYNIFARMGLIKILAKRNDWQEVGTHTQRVHEIDPTDGTARMLDMLRDRGDLIPT